MLVYRKWIKYGAGATDVNAQVIQATNTATNYTPVAVGTEATTEVSAHLNGINNALAGVASVPGDLSQTSFTAADNQSAAANVTGLAFANATVRSFVVQLSIIRNTTDAQYNLYGIQKSASWEMTQDFTGDDTGLAFTITSAGQVQYTSTSTGSTATVKFRAKVTSV